MTRVMAVGVFDLLHAGHLHYLEQAKLLGDHLTVVVAHDDTVRTRKHEPVTSMELRSRLVMSLKPVDDVIIGNAPPSSIFSILDEALPDIIALGYDQDHQEEKIRSGLEVAGYGHVSVMRVKGLSDDLDGTRKIIARILDLWSAQRRLDSVESDDGSGA